MRLIDADELEWYKVPLAEPIKKPSSDDEVYAFRLGGNDAINTIMGYAPTVDPVKHGYWIDVGDFEQCSVCYATRLKELQTYYGKATWLKTPYCSYCGARMDKVIENEVN